MAAPDFNHIDDECGENELTDEDKLLRDKFAEEYLIDRNSTYAALRVGFNHNYAREFGVSFINEGYVQRRIKELEKINPAVNTPEDVKTKIVNTLMEIMGGGGKDSDRISAAGLLHKITSPDNEDALASLIKGGVMVVPAIQSVKDWAETAGKSQSDLKSSVRD